MKRLVDAMFALLLGFLLIGATAGFGFLLAVLLRLALGLPR